MKAELIERMSAEQLQKAHAAYTQIACIYEDICGGPYGARNYREYFGIMDTREALRKRFLSLTAFNDGNKQ